MAMQTRMMEKRMILCFVVMFWSIRENPELITQKDNLQETF